MDPATKTRIRKLLPAIPVAAVSIVLILQGGGGPDFNNGDCITGGNGVKKVECSSGEARYRVGGDDDASCDINGDELLLTLSGGGDETTLCVSEIPN